MDNKELSKKITKAFNKLADESIFNEKSVIKLPKCDICGHYCTRLDIHKLYKHNIK